MVEKKTLRMEEDLKSKTLGKKRVKSVILKIFLEHLSNNDRAKMGIQSETIPSEWKIKLVESVNHLRNKSEESGEIVDNFASITF